MSPPQIVQVAVFAPLARSFSYLWPFGEQPPPVPGLLLKVPLGRRAVFGCLLAAETGSGEGLKAVAAVVDREPLFPPAMGTFFERISRYYHHPLGEVIAAGLPLGVFGLKREFAPERIYAAVENGREPSGARQRQLLEWLRSHGATSERHLKSLFPTAATVLRRLVAAGLVSLETAANGWPHPAEAAAAEDSAPDLTPEQEAALAPLRPALAGDRFAPFLLHGVTGSGKTEVYLRAAAEARRLGKKTLILVPEIALTPQLVERFRERLDGDEAGGMAVLHSGLSNGERRQAWKGVIQGRIDLVIGARSAIFAPFERLGLIIVDEEHDAGYKQSEGFRYNARDLALWRARLDRATVLLGSATPSLAGFRQAREGKIGFLPLRHRVLSRPLPEVTLVDLSGRPLQGSLSPELIAALGDNLNRGEQSLLLLNRRGFAPFLLCRDCGAVLRCRRCEISLTYYRAKNLLRCHYCDAVAAPPDTCPGCRGANLEPCGAGTERLEEELAALFPGARLARMDSDTMTRRGSYGRIVARMQAGDVDILVGTQMVAKGHDFARITLVGVINADATLFLPDFRSSERAFALLTQVSGRAGRGVLPGRVLIQTRNPGHYVFAAVIRHDYEAFFQQEAGFRRDLGYPPFGHLANIVVSGEKEDPTQQTASRLATSLNQSSGGVEVLGPAPCLLSRLRGRHRYQVLLKAAAREPLHRLLEHLEENPVRLPAGIRMTIDVDPLDMF
ncbi:MAG: primosomal protein N' [Deltaproteobacteria bacterium]|nr:primosomal protein N' [Deltaproteobacteria bacterium]